VFTEGAPGAVAVAVESFDYSRVGEQWVVLHLLARRVTDLGGPADAHLVISRGHTEDDLRYPTRACTLRPRA
jgi:hypothetical protein